jgi:hypothetical protein
LRLPPREFALVGRVALAEPDGAGLDLQHHDADVREEHDKGLVVLGLVDDPQVDSRSASPGSASRSLSQTILSLS